MLSYALMCTNAYIKEKMTALTRLVRPRQFLLLGGTVLVIIGLAGAAGLLGAISRASVFNPRYWINWVHLMFGIVVLAIAFAGSRTLQNAITLVAGIMGSTLGLSGLLFGSYAANRYNMPELADPSDHLAHLTVGVLALWAWSNRG
jgi:hypothetical protein